MIWPSGLDARPAEPEVPETESLRESVCMRGLVCGISSALGCSVPIVVTPVSDALPALESA